MPNKAVRSRPSVQLEHLGKPPAAHSRLGWLLALLCSSLVLGLLLGMAIASACCH